MEWNVLVTTNWPSLSFRYPELESGSPDLETDHHFKAVTPREPQFVPIITPPNVPLNPTCKFKLNIQLPTATMYSLCKMQYTIHCYIFILKLAFQ